MTSLLPNTLLKNRYQILQPFKEGGMGQLFLAQDHTNCQVVVVKCALQTDPAAARQFRQEAELLAKLRHPALPRVFDYVEQAGLHCLMMEYIPGCDLDEWLRQHGPAPEARVLRWADQALDALEYLHGQQPPILHRDLKPANLKLVDDGYDLIKLVDFGLARAWAGVGDLTRTGARAISPPFSPWEQYGQGTGPYSDIYALGATMYTLLSGQLPPEAIERMERDTLRPLRRLAPTISLPTEQVVQRAMATRREERWPSAGQMRQALRRSASTPRPARPVTAPPRPASNNLPLVVAGLLLALVVAVIGFLALNSSSSSKPYSSKIPPTPSVKADTTLGVESGQQALAQTTDTLTPTLTPTDTPPLSPTLPPVQTTPTPTPTLITATPTKPAVAPSLLISPTLLLPPPGETAVVGKLTKFQWQWLGTLPPDMGFEVRIWRPGDPDGEANHPGAYNAEEYAAKGWVRTTGNGMYEVDIDVKSAAGFKQNGIHLWTVALVRLRPSYERIGLEATPRELVIAIPGGPGGDKNKNPDNGGGGNNNPPPPGA